MAILAIWRGEVGNGHNFYNKPQIEKPRPLLILSTGAHFQRVSEYYIVPRTFLWIGITVKWDYVCFMYVATASRPFLRTHIFSAPAMPPTNMYQTHVICNYENKGGGKMGSTIGNFLVYRTKDIGGR